MNSKARWIPVKNTSGEEVPPYAAMEPVSMGSDGILLVTKPNRDDSNTALINGPARIAVNGRGFGSYEWPLIARYDTNESAASNGQALGTRSGYWALYPGYEGFIVWGQRSSDAYVVQRNNVCLGATGVYQAGYYPRLGRGFCCGCARFDCAKYGNQVFPPSLDLTITVGSMGTFTSTIGFIYGNFPVCANFLLGVNEVYPYYYGRHDWLFPFGESVDFNYCDGSGFNSPSWDLEESIEIHIYCRNYRPDLDGVGSIADCDGKGRWYCSGTWVKVLGAGSPKVMHTINFCGPIAMLSCDPLHLYAADSAVCNLDTPVACNNTDFQSFSDFADEEGTSVEVEAIE